MTALIGIAGCMPVAVGSVVVGGGSLVTGKVMHKDHCDGEGCAYSNLMATTLMVIGLGLVVGGGIGIAVHENQ